MTKDHAEAETAAFNTWWEKEPLFNSPPYIAAKVA
jgi:hypothetical protein